MCLQQFKCTVSLLTIYFTAAGCTIGLTTTGSLAAEFPATATTKANSLRVPWTTSRLQGMPTAPPKYRVEPALTKHRFNKPTSLCELPDGDFLVTEIGGKILSVSPTGKVRQIVDMSQVVKGDVSLWTVALHPKFSDNRWLYLCWVSSKPERHTRVSRFDFTSGKLDLSSERVIITWPAGGHNAGCIQFGKDGYLYISTGDGAGPNPPDGRTTGQDISDLLGSILRIDVNKPANGKQYSIPADNPFVNLDGARPEIWAYGLRNPWKFGMDAKTGDMFVADNGWETWELIHRIQKGTNCGWPIMEGRAALRTEVKRGPTPITPPVKDHHHSEANSVIGGPVYRGSKLPQLNGWFVYGDYITGTIWGLKREGSSYTQQTLVDTDLRIVAFCESRSGELLVVDYDYTGQIYALRPSGLADTSAKFPRRLSETGLFKSLTDLTPEAGVVPYQVKVPRWMDGAVGKRWLAVPGVGKVTLRSDGTGEYPEGTVLVKHLNLANDKAVTRLETQILLRQHGTWNPYSYQWNEDGKDAVLVDATGANLAINGKRTTSGQQRTWHVGATNECRLCHNAGSGFVLGFVPNQLDQGSQQLERLAELGHSTPTAAQIPKAFQLVDPHNSQAPLADRARSYLHVNCSMCHHPGGNAIVSFYLRRNMPFAKLKTDKGTGIGTFGMTNARLIVPGDPYRSVLFYRMSKLGYGRMPYIGSREVDGRGVAIIEAWIRGMNGSNLSAPLQSGSQDAQALQQLASDQGDSTKAMQQLLRTTEGTLALTALLHRTSQSSLRHQVAKLAKGRPTDIRGLVDAFVPERQRRATLGVKIDPQLILRRHGDTKRGKLIYFSDSGRCRSCHDAQDRKKSLGPTLRDIVKKYPRRNQLLEHVIDPSAKVDDAFAAYSVATSDGEVISGLVVSRNKSEIVVKTTQHRLVYVKTDDIEEIRRSSKSLMPNGVLSDLTAQEAADLLAYVMQLGKAAVKD